MHAHLCVGASMLVHIPQHVYGGLAFSLVVEGLGEIEFKLRSGITPIAE